MGKSPERAFMGSYRYLFSLVLLGTNVGSTLIWFFLSEPKTLAGFLSYCLALLVFSIGYSLLMAFFLIWMYRVRVTAEGIHGGTFWSTPVYMSFAEMETVEPRRFCGMPYLRIKSFRENCPTLWLPRFLATPAAFREEITERTSSFHPLRRSLENGGTKEQRMGLPLNRV